MKEKKEKALVVLGILALIIGIGLAVASRDKSNKEYEDRIKALQTELKLSKEEVAK